MENKKRLVPSIRFKEFTNDWEQEKLEKILLNTKSNFEITDALTRGKYEIFGVNGKIGYVNYLKEKFNSKILIIAKDGSVGKIQILPENSTFTSTLEGLKPLRSDKILFIYLQLSRTNLSKFHIGSTIKHLHFKDYKHTKIRVADLIEQNAISDFFENLDQLITLHQRKLSKLENIKKTLLEKMFPAEKQSKPSIRFKEFTNDWEQEKINYLYTYCSEGGTPSTLISKYYKGGNINFVKIEDTNTKYISKTKEKITKEGLNNSSSWLVPKNNIIFTNGATIGNVSINLIDLSTKQGIVGMIINQKITKTEFVYYLLKNNRMQVMFNNLSTVGTFANLTINNFSNINISIPKEIKEQNHISKLLNTLDHLITLHQRKLKKLENIKKTLLERMFV